MNENLNQLTPWSEQFLEAGECSAPFSRHNVQVVCNSEVVLNVDLADRPFGDLPSQRRVLLGEHRIEAAVFEIKFAGNTDVLSSEDAAAMLVVLSGRTSVTRLDTAEQHEMSVLFGPEGAAQPSMQVTSRGWRFSSPDDSEIFTILPNVAFVQVRAYERWSLSLKPHVEALLIAVEARCVPSVVQRLGLRYINRLTGADGEGSERWAERITPAFRGPLADPIVGPKLRGAHQQLQFELEPGIGVLINHGLVPDEATNSFGYLIDLDVFDERSTSFELDDLLVRSQRMNRTANNLFLLMLTPTQIDQMEPTTIDDNADERMM